MQGHLTKLPKEIKAILQAQQAIPQSAIPSLHWCRHYRDKQGNIIPDGARCCWVHYVGLPKRWGVRHPYYSWEEDLLDNLKKGKKYFYILKPPKIGATQFWLSYAEHQAVINPTWRNGQVAIVVGTNFGEAEQMIGRAKDIIEDKDAEDRGLGTYKLSIHQDYNTKKEFSLNTVEFRAHPANNIDAIRSKPNMRMIIIDEGAFFTIKAQDQQKIRDAFEHYIGGSDTLIVVISTAGHVPAGFMYDMYEEIIKGDSIYTPLILDYHAGLEVHPESGTSLYKKEQIDLLKDSPSFARNYMHQWGHGSGDIFDLKALDRCIRTYNWNVKQGERILSVDPGYGSSKSGLVGIEKTDKARVIQAQQYGRPSQTELISIIDQSIKLYGYTLVRFDSAYPGLLSDFRSRIACQPINFRERGQIMTDNASIQVKAEQIEIDPTFEELIKQLRAARKNEKGTVDKDIATFDLFDAFIMSLDYFSTGEIGHFKLPD